MIIRSPTLIYFSVLVEKLGYLTSTYCSTTLADCELETLVDSYWVDEIYSDSYEGLQFAIREGGRTVGAGQVTKLID